MGGLSRSTQRTQRMKIEKGSLTEITDYTEKEDTGTGSKEQGRDLGMYGGRGRATEDRKCPHRVHRVFLNRIPQNTNSVISAGSSEAGERYCGRYGPTGMVKESRVMQWEVMIF